MEEYEEIQENIYDEIELVKENKPLYGETQSKENKPSLYKTEVNRYGF